MILQVHGNVTLNKLFQKDAKDMFDILSLQKEYMRTWLPFVDKIQVVDDIKRAIKSLSEGNNV